MADDSSLSWSQGLEKNEACGAGPSAAVTRSNIKIEDMNMAKPEWWHYNDAHKGSICFAEGEIALHARADVESDCDARVKSLPGVKQPGMLFDPSTRFRDNKSSTTPDGPFDDPNMDVLASN